MGRYHARNAHALGYDLAIYCDQHEADSTMLKDLVTAARTDGPTLCDARDGLHTIAICTALHEAIRTGTVQRVTG